MKLLIVPILALATGCGLSCTQMYVPSGFAVDIEATSWPVGAWEVALSGDVEAHCTVDLPAVEGGDLGACDVEGVELSWEPHSLSRLLVTEPLPEYLHVAVLLDGVEIAAEAFEPQYEISEPNGPGCGESVNAGETMSLD